MRPTGCTSFRAPVRVRLASQGRSAGRSAWCGSAAGSTSLRSGASRPWRDCQVAASQPVRRSWSGRPGGGENNNLVESPAGKILMAVSASCDHCVPASKWSGSIVEFAERCRVASVRGPHSSSLRARVLSGDEQFLATFNQRDDLGAKRRVTGLPGFATATASGSRTVTARLSRVRRRAGAPCGARPHAAAAGVAIVQLELGAVLGPAALVAEWTLGKVLSVPLAAGGRAGKRRGGPVPRGADEPAPPRDRPGWCAARRRLDDREDLPDHALVRYRPSLSACTSCVDGTK